MSKQPLVEFQIFFSENHYYSITSNLEDKQEIIDMIAQSYEGDHKGTLVYIVPEKTTENVELLINPSSVLFVKIIECTD